MSLISLNNVNLDISGRTLLQGVSLAVQSGERIGLVGVNGAGKTSLFHLLTGFMEPAEGSIHKAGGLKISLLTQETGYLSGSTLWHAVYSTSAGCGALIDELHRLQEEYSHSHDAGLHKKIDRLHDEIEARDGWRYDNRVKTVLTSLSFEPESWNRPLDGFSGGEKRRIQLAQVLLSDFDVLLLDEPTNHLDMAMLFWLERYLNNLDQAVLTVSHDRHFLDAVTNYTWEVSGGRVTRYRGNFTSYRTESERRRLLQEKEYDAQQEFIERTEDFIRRNIAGQKTKQAQGRQKMLDRLERIAPPGREKRLRLRLGEVVRTGDIVFAIKELGLRAGSKNLAGSINLELRRGDKTVILGPNGCGKTTLLRVLLGQNTPAAGEVLRGANLNVGYYDQEQLSLPAGGTVLEAAWSLMPGTPVGEPLSWLARFGFNGENVEKPCRVLSGGEKARLCLALLIYKNPNVLVLDEPTNHLDLFTSEALVQALEDYSGTVLFVSHDRWFIEQLADSFWVFDNGQVNRSYQDLDEIFAPRREENDTVKTIKVKPTEKPKKINTWKLERLHDECVNLAESITKGETRMAELSLSLSEREIYADDNKRAKVMSELENLQTSLPVLRQELEQKEEEWLLQSAGD